MSPNPIRSPMTARDTLGAAVFPARTAGKAGFERTARRSSPPVKPCRRTPMEVPSPLGDHPDGKSPTRRMGTIRPACARQCSDLASRPNLQIKHILRKAKNKPPTGTGFSLVTVTSAAPRRSPRPGNNLTSLICLQRPAVMPVREPDRTAAQHFCNRSQILGSSDPALAQ